MHSTLTHPNRSRQHPSSWQAPARLRPDVQAAVLDAVMSAPVPPSYHDYERAKRRLGAMVGFNAPAHLRDLKQFNAAMDRVQKGLDL
jgi:hypothetical protein